MNRPLSLDVGSQGAFYGRHSTDKQDIGTQKGSVYHLAKEWGLEIVKDYEDKGVSAFYKPREKRTELRRLLTDVADGKYKFVMVYKADRLARDPIEHDFIRSYMEKHDIPVIISSTRELYNDGDFLSQILKDGMTKMESDTIRVRTSDAYQNRIGNGMPSGGKPPFGYRYHPEKQYEQDTANLLIVQKIFQWYREGEGFQIIAQRLQEETGEEKWNKVKVKLIVTNPFYAGYLTSGRFKKGSTSSLEAREKWNMTKCELIEPIMDLKEWEYFWGLYHHKVTKKTPPKFYQTPFLAKDILYCATCDVLMKGKDQRTSQGRHGSQIYYCKSCKQRHQIDSIHDVIHKKVHRSVFSNGETSQRKVFEALHERYEQEIAMLQKNIHDLYEQSKGYKIQTQLLEHQIQQVYKYENPEKQAEFKMLDVLIMCRLTKKQRVREIEELIGQHEKQILYVKTVKQNVSEWQDVMHDIRSNSDDANIPILRRLYLRLFEKITIASDGKMEFEERVDLDAQWT